MSIDEVMIYYMLLSSFNLLNWLVNIFNGLDLTIRRDCERHKYDAACILGSNVPTATRPWLFINDMCCMQVIKDRTLTHEPQRCLIWQFNGLSNYQCKRVSILMHRYGHDSAAKVAMAWYHHSHNIIIHWVYAKTMYAALFLLNTLTRSCCTFPSRLRLRWGSWSAKVLTKICFAMQIFLNAANML